MTITEMRNYIGVSRAEFSRRYNIPLRTLESWESEVRTPPEYVLQLLEESVRRTDIIEVTFIYDTLLQNGKIYPWSKANDKYGADQAAYKTVLNVVFVGITHAPSARRNFNCSPILGAGTRPALPAEEEVAPFMFP